MSMFLLVPKMRLLGLLCCLIGAIAAAPEKSHYGFAGRIVGGIDALPHEFPSLVSIRLHLITRDLHICGGTIVTPFWILTAAHCITESPFGRFLVWAGSHNISATESNRQIREVERSIPHPDYKGGVNPSDIALMRLRNKLDLYKNIVECVHLPPQGPNRESGEVALAGWGSTSNDNLPNMPAVLQKIRKPLIDLRTCTEANGGEGNSPLGPTNICTGPLTGGISACSGDSGGPLYLIGDGVQEQVGIVSWGWMPCGTYGRPSVYVGVAMYRDWIDNCMEGECQSTS